MEKFRVMILMVVLLLPRRSRSCFVSLESECGTSTGTLMYREAASNDITVYLLGGQYVENSFVTVGNDCNLMVNNVAYSNDGIGDCVTVSVDGSIVGTFLTRPLSGEGDLWNDIQDTGPVGNETQIPAGEHTIKLVATSSDTHGVELDRVTLTLQCGTNTNSGIECPATEVEITDECQGVPDGGSDESDGGGGGLSTEATIGVAVGVVGAFIGIPGCIFATYQIYKCMDLE